MDTFKSLNDEDADSIPIDPATQSTSTSVTLGDSPFAQNGFKSKELERDRLAHMSVMLQRNGLVVDN